MSATDRGGAGDGQVCAVGQAIGDFDAVFAPGPWKGRQDEGGFPLSNAYLSP